MRKLLKNNGARGRNRTGTVLPPRDFKLPCVSNKFIALSSFILGKLPNYTPIRSNTYLSILGRKIGLLRESVEPTNHPSLSFLVPSISKASRSDIGHKRTIKASFSFQKCSKICFGLISPASRSNKFETRGFESIATNYDTSKNNHLANSKNQKTTSNNLKSSSSAYTAHTLAFMCVLFLSACSKVSQTPNELERAAKPLTLIAKSKEGVLISDPHGNLYSYSEDYYFAQTIMASDLKVGQILIGVKDEEN